MFKKSYKTILTAIIASFLLTACAAPTTMRPSVSNKLVAKEALEQQKLLLQSMQKDMARIADISFPLLTRNAKFCGKNLVPMDGISAWTLDLFSPAQQNMMHNIYGLGHEVTISNITKNSPAAKAGLRKGDIIIALNGVKIPSGKNGLKLASEVFRKSGTKTSQIMLKRKGKIFTTNIKPKLGCSFPVVIDRKAAEINAYADGKRIIISKGMLRFAENDTELALVIAHELAHNTMGHIKKKQTNAIAGTLGGALLDIALATAGVASGNQFSSLGGQMGALAHSVAFEQEADYVGMYYMARAGYNINNVAYFWRRMAVENGGRSIYIRTTHPTSPERFVAIEKTVVEINNKKRSKLPLLPNIKKKR